MNKKRPLPEDVIHPEPLVWSFLFIHNLWYKFLFIHPQPQVWVSFYSSTISCIVLISFIHNLLKMGPIPGVVDK
jgi:hypothetical protein